MLKDIRRTRTIAGDSGSSCPHGTARAVGLRMSRRSRSVLKEGSRTGAGKDRSLIGVNGARLMAGLGSRAPPAGFLVRSPVKVAQGERSSKTGATIGTAPRGPSGDLSLLFAACRHGNLEAVATYLDRQPDLVKTHDSGSGNTLLHIACQCGTKRASKLCLRRGADINARNFSGQTCLHFCFAYGFEALAQYLRDKGADDSLRNADGLTPYEGLSIRSLERL